MPSRDPNIVRSGLSGPVTEQGITVEVQIYRLEEQPGWALEVVNFAGASTVWEDLFDTDELALTAFQRTVADEGMGVFIDRGKIIPFRR